MKNLAHTCSRTETSVNKTCCILLPCYRRLKISKVQTFRDRIKNTRLLHDLFLSCSLIALQYCRDLFRYPQTLGSNILISKNACWPSSQNPHALMLSLASFDRFAFLLWSSFPDRSNSSGSIPVSLQTPDIRFAVRSHKSLWLMLTEPSFLQFMLC